MLNLMLNPPSMKHHYSGTIYPTFSNILLPQHHLNLPSVPMFFSSEHWRALYGLLVCVVVCVCVCVVVCVCACVCVGGGEKGVEWSVVVHLVIKLVGFCCALRSVYVFSWPYGFCCWVLWAYMLGVSALWLLFHITLHCQKCHVFSLTSDETGECPAQLCLPEWGRRGGHQVQWQGELGSDSGSDGGVGGSSGVLWQWWWRCCWGQYLWLLVVLLVLVLWQLLMMSVLAAVLVAVVVMSWRRV